MFILKEKKFYWGLALGQIPGFLLYFWQLYQCHQFGSGTQCNFYGTLPVFIYGLPWTFLFNKIYLLFLSDTPILTLHLMILSGIIINGLILGFFMGRFLSKRITK